MAKVQAVCRLLGQNAGQPHSKIGRPDAVAFGCSDLASESEVWLAGSQGQLTTALFAIRKSELQIAH